MPLPELQPRPDGYRVERLLGPTARGLLRQVERSTGSRVVVRQAPPDIHDAYAQISYGAEGRPHVIAVSDGAAPFLDYLVGHECGHALRFFGAPEPERVLAFSDERHLARATRSLVPEIQKRCEGISGGRAEDLAAMYHRGLVGQVVNFPADLRIETWLREQHPELRKSQERGLRANIAELQLGLHPEVQAATPPSIFRIEASLNAGYCAYIAELLGDPGLAEPYRHCGFGQVGEEIAKQIWDTRSKDYEQDRRDAEVWAKRFGVARWFRWQHYRW